MLRPVSVDREKKAPAGVLVRHSPSLIGTIDCRPEPGWTMEPVKSKQTSAVETTRNQRSSRATCFPLLNAGTAVGVLTAFLGREADGEGNELLPGNLRRETKGKMDRDEGGV